MDLSPESDFRLGKAVLMPIEGDGPIYHFTVNKELRKAAAWPIGGMKTMRPGGIWYTFCVTEQKDATEMPSIVFGIQVPDLDQAVLIHYVLSAGFQGAKIGILKSLFDFMLGKRP